MNTRPVILCTVLLFLSIFSTAVPADINWKLYLNSTGSNPIQSATMSDTDEFVILEDAVSGGSSSADIIEALSGTTFALAQPPNGPLEIHLILNVQGNTFLRADGKTVSMNMKIEALSDGNPVDTLPMTITIPSGVGLNTLLELSNCPRNSITFAYFNGGILEKDGIETQSLSRGIVISFNSLGTIVGGDNSALGFPASVEYSTWYNIKTLFE